MLYEIEQRTSDLTAGTIRGLTTIPHIHPHLELIYLAEGSSIAHADNGGFLLEAGGLFLSFPNQIHYYQDQSPIRGYMLIFSPDLFADFEKIFEKQVPVHAVLPAEKLPKDMQQQMERILAIARSDMPLKQTIIKGYLMAILGAILPELPLMEVTANQDTVKSLLTYCIENYTEPLTLDAVSEQLHLSKYYICHIFKERMGVGFAEFLNRLRIANACRVMEQGSSITEAAYASGSSSIRTFNRVFAKSMGMPPSAYMAEKNRKE